MSRHKLSIRIPNFVEAVAEGSLAMVTLVVVLVLFLYFWHR
jgi:hypothetical protein